MNEELLKKAKEAKSVDELLKLAKENKVELSKEKAQEIFSRLHREGELVDDELDSVSGGGCKEVEFSGPKYVAGHFVTVGNSNTCSCGSYEFEVMGYDVEEGWDTAGRAYGISWVKATEIVYFLKCAHCGRTKEVSESSIRGYSDHFGNRV